MGYRLERFECVFRIAQVNVCGACVCVYVWKCVCVCPQYLCVQPRMSALVSVSVSTCACLRECMYVFTYFSYCVSLYSLEMPLLPQLARIEYAGLSLDLSRLGDMSGVLRQRAERLAEDLEVQRSVRRAVWEAAQGAAWRDQLEAERRGGEVAGGGGGGGGWPQWRTKGTTQGGVAVIDVGDVAKKEDVAIARIESELDLLQRLRNTR